MNKNICLSFILLLTIGTGGFMFSCSPSGDKSKPVKKNILPARIVGKVEFNSSGCFHNYSCKLFLLQRDSVVFACIANNGKTPVEKQLSRSQVKAFEIFFRQLKDLDESGGCTTVNTYRVTFKNETIRKSDGSCDWNGFDNLYRELFNADYLSAFN